MALLSKDNTKYARVESILVGKNLMQFTFRIYTDVNASPIYDETVVAPYDLNGLNPFMQAYQWVQNTMPDLQDFYNDTQGVLQPAKKKKVK